MEEAVFIYAEDFLEPGIGQIRLLEKLSQGNRDEPVLFEINDVDIFRRVAYDFIG